MKCELCQTTIRVEDSWRCKGCEKIICNNCLWSEESETCNQCTDTWMPEEDKVKLGW